MLRTRNANTALALAALMASNSLPAIAQDVDMFVRVTPTEASCPTDTYVVGYIGYKDLTCNCSFTIGPEGPRSYQFRAEPVIGGVEPGSPADGKLRAGDVITAIDGQLITTSEGGRRFARMMPDVPVVLTVRRGGREIEYTLVPEQACYEISSPPPPRAPLPDTIARPDPLPARVAPPGRAPVVDAAPPRRAAPAPPPPQLDLTRGWFGFSITCSRCVAARTRSGMHWDFAAPPEVNRVETFSPAHRAGLRAGDVLTQINGSSLTSPRGGHLFGSVEPGDTVTFKYRRNNEEHEVQIVADSSYRSPGEWVRADANERPQTRFSGVVGNAHVSVTGGPVSVNRTENEVVLRIGDVTVRIRRTDTLPN